MPPATFCGDCTHYEPEGVEQIDYGTCRRGPPSPLAFASGTPAVFVVEEEIAKAVWPIVTVATRSCGEYKSGP